MTKYLIYILFVILAIAILNSCSNSAKYELTIDKEPYFGNEMRTDGYYYYQVEGNGSNEFTHVLFFYKNGVVFDGKRTSTVNLDNVEKYYLNGEHKVFLEYNDVWSTFKVNKDSLVFERWNPPTVSQGPEPILYYCEIINDTTFEVFKYKLFSEKEFIEVSETYHFRKFDHKPDSTKSFIK